MKKEMIQDSKIVEQIVDDMNLFDDGSDVYGF